MSDQPLPTTSLRPGPEAWGQLVLAEIRSVVRDTSGLIVPLGMPLLIMVMFGMNATDPIPDLDGLTGFDVHVVPLVSVMVIALIGVVNMPSHLATYRRTGVLRRLAVTPVHPAMVLVAQVVTSLIQTLVGLALAVGVGAALYGLAAPRSLGTAITAVVLVIVAMYAVGMLVAAIAPTPQSSAAIGLVVFFAIGATGGLFGSMDMLPDAMAAVGRVLPFGGGFEALQAAWIGTAVPTTAWVGLAATTVVAGGLSAVWFRWE